MSGSSIETNPDECPHCGSPDVEAHREGGLLKGPFTIKPRRRCRHCGNVFEPPAGKFLSAAVAIAGLAMMIVPWPGLIAAIRANSVYSGVTRAVFVIAGLCFGSHVASVGLRSLLQSTRR